MTGSARGAQYDRFVSLFARHEQAVRSFVRSLLPSWQDVDDVMQEIVLVCWRKFDAFEVSRSADELVRRACIIARFEALGHRRDCARDRRVFREGVIEDFAADAEARLKRAGVERKTVERRPRELPASERRLLALTW